MSDVTAEPVQLGQPPNGQRSLGTTRVANDVIAWIVALTALQVNGVHAMYRPAGQSIERILRRPVAHRGVRVEMADDGLRIDIWIVIEAGNNVPLIGGDVQKSVADAIARMLGLEVAEVNVYVSEVVFV